MQKSATRLPSRPIDPKRNRWMFSLGTSGRDMYYQLYSAQMMTFIIFTKTLTDSQFWIINLILVGRMVFDAVIDPLIGQLIENTRSRWGRFKPWMIVGMIVSAFVTIAIFVLPLDGWDFVIFFGIGTFVLAFFYSLNDIAYWGMLPALTSEPNDRAKVTALAALTGAFGSALAVILIPPLTNGDMAIGGSAAIAFPVMAIICCCAMMGTQLFTIFGAREPENIQLAAEKAPKLTIKDTIKVVVKNDQLLWASLAIFMQCVAGSVATSTLLTFYVYLRFGYVGLFVPASMIGFAIGGATVNLFLAKWHEKYGRKKCTNFSLIFVLAGALFILLTGLLLPLIGMDFGSLDLMGMTFSTIDIMLFAALIVGQVFTGFGSNLFYLTMLVSICNTVEYNENRTGQRQEGLIYSVRPFVLQNGSAVTQAIVGAAFIGLGLNTLSNKISDLENAAGVEIQALREEGAAKGILDAVSNLKNENIAALLSGVDEGKIFALLAAITIIPMVLLTLGWFVYRKKYFIDEEYYDKMRAETQLRGGI